jgi:hypothetical protein
MPRRLLRTYHLQLTDDEFRLLKELKGAGNRGRNFDPRVRLERLMNAGYVTQDVIEGTTIRYVLTDFGRIALDNKLAG